MCDGHWWLEWKCYRMVIKIVNQLNELKKYYGDDIFFTFYDTPLSSVILAHDTYIQIGLTDGQRPTSLVKDQGRARS